jgi:hypothetical protein
LTASVGAVSTVAKANVVPEGQSATASVGIIFVYGQLDTSQTPDYSDVATSQTPNYTDVATSQTPTYTTITGGRDAA